MTVARIERDGPPRAAGIGKIAADLHDGVSQHLFAAALDLDELRALPDLDPRAREVIDRLAARIGAGSRELRAVLVAMLAADDCAHPVPAGALPDQIAAAVADFAAEHPVAVELRTEGAGPEPAPAAARVLLRAVREGLANVAKHSGARHALVLLRRGRRTWVVEVHDDGDGDPAAIVARSRAPDAFGVVSLHLESGRLGGRLEVCRAPELGGVQLVVAVPVGTPALVTDPASAEIL